MNRRELLKGLAAAPVVMALPDIAPVLAEAPYTPIAKPVYVSASTTLSEASLEEFLRKIAKHMVETSNRELMAITPRFFIGAMPADKSPPAWFKTYSSSAIVNA